MAVKYYCPKCEKRYIDWGAEKLKFVCPECEGEKLLEVGRAEGAPAAKRPTLKRKKKKAAPPPPPPTAAAFKDEDAAAPDLDTISGEDVDATGEDFDDTVEVAFVDEESAGAEDAADADED